MAYMRFVQDWAEANTFVGGLLAGSNSERCAFYESHNCLLNEADYPGKVFIRCCIGKLKIFFIHIDHNETKRARV